MPLIFKLLKATKDLAAGSANLMYSAGPSGAGAILSNIRFYNATGASTSVELSVTKGSTTSKFAVVGVNLGAAAIYNTEITLAPGEKVEASTGVVLDCVVCGAERV